MTDNIKHLNFYNSNHCQIKKKYTKNSVYLIKQYYTDS